MGCCNNTYKKMYIQDQAINPPGPPTPELGYGLLYNWYAVDDVRGIFPDGFRIPTRQEWIDALVAEGGTLSGSSVLDGGSQKSTRLISDGQPYWAAPNTGAGNGVLKVFASGERSGFTGVYSSITTTAALWTSDNGSFGGKKSITFSSNTADAGVANEGTSTFRVGLSVRGVSDTEPPTATVQDQDGNDYTWVQIGSQYWLSQNLRTETYNNGDPIPTGLSNAAWAATTSGAWAYPNGDPTLPI